MPTTTQLVLQTMSVITRFLNPESEDQLQRCQLSLEYLLPDPNSDIPSMDEAEFQAWVHREYGPATLKKVYEFKDLPDPKLIDILKYHFPDVSDAKLQNFIRKLTTTDTIVISVWLDRIADPICAMIKAGVYQKFKY